MHSKSTGTGVWVGWVPALLAGLIGLDVGLAGERSTRALAAPAVHQDRAVVASAASSSAGAVAHRGVSTAEGRFCRPVWSATDAAATEPVACKPVASPSRLMSL
ncbi:MAG: hypothetical protein SF172_03625 [Burkholderiales bacterium]|nr:hypothetical protein [Burkholderiales bacterium]